MTFRFVSRLLASGLILVGFSVSAQVLNVGFIERAPHIYAKADGTVKGKFGRTLKSLFRNAQVDADLVRVRIDDIARYFDIDGLDAYIATPLIVDVPDDYHFSAKPLLTLQFYAYHQKSKPDIKSLEDMQNVKVVVPFALATMQGKVKDWLLDPANQITVVSETTSLEQAAILLRRGKADYAITHIDPSATATMFSQRLNSSQLKSNPIFALPMYLVIRKTFPQSEQVIERINQVL